jgi:very-short-patch-repair endonuclease
MIAEKLHYHYNTEISRQLRKEQTLAEKLLWERLRNRKFNGIKFKRQHSINSFITGFYCYSNRIIIEVDGSIHNDKGIKEYDNSRQVYFVKIKICPHPPTPSPMIHDRRGGERTEE